MTMQDVRKSRSAVILEARIVSAFLAVMVWLVISVVPAYGQQWGGDSSESDMGGSGGFASSELGPEQLSQQLGISLPQLQQLGEQASEGGIGNAENEKLCATIAAKHLSPDEAESIGHTLGLPDDDVAHLVDCVRFSLGKSGQALSPEGLGPGNAPYFTPGPAVTGPSEVEKAFHALDTPYKVLAAPNLSQLDQFGYKLFAQRGPLLLPTFDNEPVGPDYLVGPGDELNVLVWGRINRTIKLLVQRNGTVLVPQIGPIPVAGLNFAQVQKLIESQIDQIEGVQSDVTMGRIRTIQVFVIGQVAEPGLRTVSALAHVSDALNAAGGVLKTGSLRRIELRRDNRVIKQTDLYSMLLRGDTSGDERLDSRDVVFVPVIGPVVGVAGDVRNPAIYELNGVASLEGVLRMAGGVSAFGYDYRIQVERVQNHAHRVALDVSLSTLEARRFVVQDGDLVKVFTVLPEETNTVTLQGNVNRPGTYQWAAGMRVVDLIRAGQGLRDHTFFSYALLKRKEGATREAHFLRVNLGDALSDEISLADLQLTPQDTLTVYSEGEISEIPTVKISGEVEKPGIYPLTAGMKVRDLVYEAGGQKQNAYLVNAQLARTQIVNGSSALHMYQNIDLAAALDGVPADNLALQAGDQLAIVQATNWHNPWVVQVKGEALRPGPYVINEGESLASVLERCGGIRSDGYLSGLMLIRQSVRRMQQETLKRINAQLQTELTRGLLMPVESTQQQQQPSLEDKAAALTMLKGMITQGAEEAAIGRVVLNANSLNAVQGSADSMPLEDGDEIIIPKMPFSVNVAGEVYGATAVAYDPSLTVADYINRAGGLTEDAEQDQIIVVKANGAILSEEEIKYSEKNRIFPLLPVISGGLMDVHLAPGDTVYVPTKLVFVNPLQRTLAITQIVANAAQGIAYAALLGTLLP
jgi:protein involved in polysaccharide export with SLBB domain